MHVVSEMGPKVDEDLFDFLKEGYHAKTCLSFDWSRCHDHEDILYKKNCKELKNE